MNLKRDKLPNFMLLDKKFDVDKINQVFIDNFGLDYSRNHDLFNKHTYFEKIFQQKLVTQGPRLRWDYHSFISGSDSDSTYQQIPVTKYNPATTTKSFQYRPIKKRIDERSFSSIMPWAQNTQLEEALGKFHGFVHRVRLAILEPGASIKEHIDYNTNYSVRYHIPIVTNSGCKVSIRRKKEIEVKHLPADGSCWFINQGYPHCVWNRGKTIRAHLIICVSGQEDLKVIQNV